MISNAQDVDTYVATVPEDRRAAIVRLRDLCKRNLAGFEERMEYGMPCYHRDGRPEISFASQKQYIAFYVLKKPVLDEFRDELGASSIGKGCVRFKKPEQINFDVIGRLLLRNAESAAEIC